ncbi:MAG: DUF1285 domain-containing protein [Alphaproteobacteria bacterium]|nr:DUF1285 domain-containing protein [Alphaproteobacteria bacterium]
MSEPSKRPPDPLAIARSLQTGRLPPIDRWNPPNLLQVDMRIATDGTWYYQGSPIGRKPMVRLFSSVLRREDDGRFYLITPMDKLPIAVDDAPFVAVELTCYGEGREQVLVFRTNVDDEVMAGPGHPIAVLQHPDTGAPRPYVLVRGRLQALLARAVFYQLVDRGVEEEAPPHGPAFGVWSAGCFFRIGGLDEIRTDE